LFFPAARFGVSAYVQPPDRRGGVDAEQVLEAVIVQPGHVGALAEARIIYQDIDRATSERGSERGNRGRVSDIQRKSFGAGRLQV
jgi:hypothetical protein